MPARKPHASKPAGTGKKVEQIGRYIVADPAICHGKSTFRDTPIPVADVLEKVAQGMAWEHIVEEWRGSIPPQAMAEAVQLATEALLEHAAEYVPPAAGRRMAG